MCVRLLFVVLVSAFIIPIHSSAQVKWKIPKSYQKKPVDKKGNIVDWRIEYVQGKWQETQRKSLQSEKPEPFTDTIFFTIKDREGKISQGSRLSMMGEAAIRRAELQVASDFFTITSLRQEQMVIQDDKYQHFMERVDAFTKEGFGKDSVQRENNENAAVVLFSDMEGGWKVYKKTAAPGVIKPGMRIIYELAVSNIVGSTADGTVGFSEKDSTVTLPVKYNQNGEKITITAADQSFSIMTHKAAGGELVFKDENGILYYAKKK